MHLKIVLKYSSWVNELMIHFTQIIYFFTHISFFIWSQEIFNINKQFDLTSLNFCFRVWLWIHDSNNIDDDCDNILNVTLLKICA